MPEQTSDVWVVDTCGCGFGLGDQDRVFRTEVEAYRDALPSMKSVVFLPFGVEVNDAAKLARERKASE